MDTLDGAYSLVLMSSTKAHLRAGPLRLPTALLSAGRRTGCTSVASESCALKAVGADFIARRRAGRNPRVRRKRGWYSRREHCKSRPKKLCVFEYIYFARPDSVHGRRFRPRMHGFAPGSCWRRFIRRMRTLSSAFRIRDWTRRSASARASGIPYGIGLIKNKYIGRTFISPGQSTRTDQVQIKLSAVEENRLRQTCCSHRRLHRPRHDEQPHCPAAAGSGREGDPYAHFRTAVPASLLLWDGHRFRGAPDRLPP